MTTNEIKSGNYKATVKQVKDGYGETAFCVMVLCMTGTHSEGDVLFLKNCDTKSSAIRTAKRELAKVA